MLLVTLYKHILISHLFRIIMILLHSGNGVPFHSQHESFKVEVTLLK